MRPAATEHISKVSPGKSSSCKLLRSVPVFVVVGDRDPVRSLYVAPLRQLRPDWKVTEIEDAGHINCIVKPGFRKAISEWLTAQP